MIQTVDELRGLLQKLRGEREIALDCEFHGEGRYRPELHLVQIATRDSAAAIPGELDLAPLGDMLADPAVRKVFHAGEEDLRLLARATGKPIRNVLDTQIAAAFAGYGASPSYAALVERILGVALPKAHQYSNWAARPLSKEQLEYALNDVRYLPAVAQALEEELDRRGRLQWAAEATEEMVARAFSPPDRSRLYLKLGPIHSLSRRQLAILREVAAWRDQRAEATNRSLGRVALDEALRQLAFRPPRHVEELRKVRGIHDHHGLFAAVERALKLPDDACPPLPEQRTEDERTELASALLGVSLRRLARELDLAPSALANRAQLDALAAWHFAGRPDPPPDIRLLTGWRRDAAGELLLAVLDGRYTLRVEAASPDGIALEPFQP